MKIFAYCFCFLFFFAGLNAQTVVWEKNYWPNQHPNGVPMPRSKGGEDWFYDIKADNTGNFIASGFVTYPTWDYIDGCTQHIFTNKIPNCVEMELSQRLLPFETDRHIKGFAMGSIARIAADGTQIFLRVYIRAELFKVIPTSDGGALAVGVTTATKAFGDGGTNDLPYNPTASAPNNVFTSSVCPTIADKNRTHAVAVKLDASYNVQWINLYGIEDFTGNGSVAYNAFSQFFDVAQKANGNFIMVGQAADNNNLTLGDACGSAGSAIKRSFAIEVNQNGFVVWKKLYGPANKFSYFFSVIASGNNFFAGGTEGSTEQIESCTPKIKAFVKSFDNSFMPTETWTTLIPDGDINKSHFNSHININSAGEILFPIGMNCNDSRVFGFQGLCEEGRIYRLDNSGNIISFSSIGPIKAFDLKLGIIPTNNDGGFAVVSTKNTHVVPTPNQFDNNPSCNFSGGNNPRQMANSDAYVAKFDALGNLQWSTTFDIDATVSPSPPGDPSTWIVPDPSMRDVKRQECLYSIAKTADGGFVIGGNSSSNFDDAYVAKIDNTCDVTLNNHQLGKTFDNQATPGVFAEGVSVYAGNTITAGNNKFVVENIGEVEFRAAQEIKLLPGFHAMEGGKFHAFIDPTLNCTPGQVFRQGETEQITDSPTNYNNSISSSVKLFPNPTNGVFELEINFNETQFTDVIIQDVLGRNVFSLVNEPIKSYYTKIDLTKFGNGLYFLTVKSNSEIISKKINVIQ